MVNPQCQKLGDLLEGIVTLPPALEDCEVCGLAVDSRKVNPGDLFLALQGRSVDGADYLQDALNRGAVALLWDSGRDISLHQGVPVDRLAEQVGVIASRFYGAPSEALRIAAVTGTDGKSSVTHFIASAMEQVEPGSAVIGTLGGYLIQEKQAVEEGGHTTPPPLELQRMLKQLQARGAVTVALEASSHGIDQHRLAGCAIDTAVLTQAGRDHLDYHGTVDAYHKAKRALFQHPGLRAAVVNLDDLLGQKIATNLPDTVQVIRYSTEAGHGADLLGEVLAQDREGMEVQLCYQQEFRQIRIPLYGRFNLSNLLAALGTLISWQVPFAAAVDALSCVEAVPGRMEYFSGLKKRATLLVDYAHTPGALEAVLQAARQHLQGACRGALWVVFGCGGDRDRGKRPEMGRIAERGADHVILTSDNPRSEVPSAILSQILQGVNNPDEAMVIEDRERAIHYAWQHAEAGDVVLIAGKGHERSQWIGAECLPFSDRDIVAALIQEGING